MRILFLHGVSDFYGASRCLVRLAAALKKDGHSVVVWVPEFGPLCPMLEAVGAVCEVAPELNAISRTKYSRKRSVLQYWTENALSAVSLARKIRAFRPDLVHTNTCLLPSAGLAARLSGAPHLWHVREWFGEFPRAWSFYQWYIQFCADRVICVSQSIADQFHPALRTNLRVLYDGFPASEFEAVTAERARAFRTAFGLEGCLAVGLVGRIKWKRKGQDIFLRAVSLLPKNKPEARFLCIGSPFPGNEEHLIALQKLAEELSVTREWIVTGDVKDNLGAIAALDVLVHPAAQPEPFSGAVVEAMALGKPVIGTNLGGTPEQIENNVTGFLVPPDDPPALASSIQTLLQDQSMRLAMGARGRERYQKYFSWDPFYQSILAEYARITKGKQQQH